MDGSDSSERGKTYTVTVTVSRSDGIGDVLEAITEVNGGLTVKDVRAADRRTVPIDVDELTATQLETLIRAVDLGYYETPRKVSLDVLREEFDVSKSAVSQRLRKAESSLVRGVVEGIASAPSRERDEKPDPEDGTNSE